MTLKRSRIDNARALCIMAPGHGSRDSFRSLNLLCGSRFLASDYEYGSDEWRMFYYRRRVFITGKLSRNSMKEVNCKLVTPPNTAPRFCSNRD